MRGGEEEGGRSAQREPIALHNEAKAITKQSVTRERVGKPMRNFIAFIAFIVMQRCLIMCLNRRTRCTHVYRYVETFLLLPTQCKLFYTI